MAAGTTSATPESIFCIQCGAKDTIAERCKNCAKNATRWSNPKQTASGSGTAQGNCAGHPKEVMVSPFSIPPPPIVKQTSQPSSNKERKA